VGNDLQCVVDVRPDRPEEASISLNHVDVTVLLPADPAFQEVKNAGDTAETAGRNKLGDSTSDPRRSP
jgi:hypothetical protein